MIGWRRGIMLVIAVIAACVLIARPARRTDARSRIVVPPGELRPRNQVLDDSGYGAVNQFLRPWRPDARLSEVAREWAGIGSRGVAMTDAQLAEPGRDRSGDVRLQIKRASFQLYDGDAVGSYETITRLRQRGNGPAGRGIR